LKEIDAPTRRRFLHTLAALGGATALSPLSGVLRAEQEVSPQKTTDPHAQIKMGQEDIVILIYPGFTAIDALAPEYILSGMMGVKIRLVAKSSAPVKCETGFEVVPQLTFEQCPAKPTLLLVPGGTDGTLQALEDPATMAFIRRVGGAAEMAGSVCTGSLLLGAAGLLEGYEATSHWQTVELLPLVGAKPSTDRVVFDRNRVTGAGVTAGLDFALQLVRHYRGDFYAKGMQLLAQYDPQPPFPGGGDPKTADPAVVALLNEMHKPFVELTAGTIKKTLSESPSAKGGS